MERKPRGYWSAEACLQESKNYTTLMEFRENASACYQTAQRKGWLATYTWLKKTPRGRKPGTKKMFIDFSVHFSTKGQDVNEVMQKLTKYLKSDDSRVKIWNCQTILHHCFTPKDILAEKGFSTEVLDRLNKITRINVCWYGVSGKNDVNVDRLHMLINLKRLNGVAIFIGEIKGGVETEYTLAKQLGVKTIQL